MSLKCRPAALAATVAAMLAAVLLVALAVSGSEAFAARKHRTHHAKRANLPTLPNPAVLATPAPTAPIPFVEGLKQRDDSRMKYDFASARVIATDERGSQVIVLTAYGSWNPDAKPSRQVCAYWTDPIWPASGGGTCVPLADFKRDGAISIGSMLSESEVPDNVVAVLPNGVDTVTVKSPTGSRQLPVENNLVRFWRHDEQTLHFNGSAGPVRVVIAPGIE